MLAEAKRVDEVKSIRDKAEAMQVYAKQAKDRDLIAHATEIRMRAEIRAGELLREMEKNKGAQGTGSNQHQVRSHDATAPLKLSDIDVTKTQSSRCGSCGHRQPFAPETIVPAASTDRTQGKSRGASDEGCGDRPTLNDRLDDLVRTGDRQRTASRHRVHQHAAAGSAQTTAMALTSVPLGPRLTKAAGHPITEAGGGSAKAIRKALQRAASAGPRASASSRTRRDLPGHRARLRWSQTRRSFGRARPRAKSLHR